MTHVQARIESEPITREPLRPGKVGRNRAFVKVQDGCENRCTFCVNTLLRGRSTSRSILEVVSEIQRLVEAGYHEVVLTGVHLGSFGQDFSSPAHLTEMIRAVFSDIDISQLRLSSVEPWDLSEGSFDLWSDPRLCPHLHLPLQSGSDSVLRRILRRTTRESFATLVQAARTRINDLTLTGDVIVGFPGESDQEFADTQEYVASIRCARLHVFTFSPRPGTSAARMSGQVPGPTKHARYVKASDLSNQLWASWQSQHVGHTVDVLWESAHGAYPDGYEWSGLTSNYLRVFTRSCKLLYNSITSVVIASQLEGRLLGVPTTI